MPRRKQSNPQPVKLESEGGEVVCDPGCLVLDSDFLLSGELEFGDSDIIGVDRNTGMTVFSLSVEDVDDESTGPPHSAFPSFLSCKGCGQLLGDSPLGTGLDLGHHFPFRFPQQGMGLDLGAELYCLTCEEGIQCAVSIDSSQAERQNLSDRFISSTSNGKRSGGKTHITHKLYSCSLCAFTSRYSNHLKRHMRIHDGQKPYCCPACPYASTQLVNLQRHARTHTGEKPYGCPQCSYACSSRGNLRRHQRMHAQDRPQRREKKRQVRRKKADVETQEVVSNVTLRVSRDSGFLQTLGGLGSPSAPLPVLLFPLCCRMCGLTLEEADLEGEKVEGDMDGGQVCHRCSLERLVKDGTSSLCSSPGSRRSQRGQRGAKLYRCPHCPFLSQYPNHLARHAHTHSEEKPHHCPHCPYTSSHLDNLKRHLRVHTGEKPYCCVSCSYACGNLANLRRHERIHSGSKPFHCGICGYSCNQSMNLKRHMLRHTGEKPYACAECSYTTGHWDNYKRHQRKHGHNTDSWDKHTPINGLSWGKDATSTPSQG